MDHNEFCCIFDTTQYTGTPDAEPCPQALDVPRLIERFDALCNQGREQDARDLLEQALQTAKQGGDWRAELSVTNELLGQYRRTQEKDKALDAVNHALEIIRVHHLGRTVSGATILLNAATTLKAFGHAAESIPIAPQVQIWDAHNQWHIGSGGLYNNMALSYDDIDDVKSAERFFMLALKTIEQTDHPENDSAVTWCNLAEMYGKRDLEDERVGDCLEMAWECLNAPGLPRDGYHAFTISKCAPTFDYYGYFLYAKELRERAEKIYAGT